MCCDAFSLSSLISHAFSALCMYLKFGHHPHPLGYHCAKFCFFCGLHCWASPRRKITYSNTQSHSPSLFDVPGTEAFASELNRSYFMCWWWMCINWIFFFVLHCVRLYGENLVIQFQDTRQWFDTHTALFSCNFCRFEQSVSEAWDCARKHRVCVLFELNVWRWCIDSNRR